MRCAGRSHPWSRDPAMQLWHFPSSILPNSSHPPRRFAVTADVGGPTGDSHGRVLVVADELCAVPHARRLHIARSGTKRCAQDSRRSSLVSRLRLYTPYDIANVVRDEQGACPVDCHAGWATEGIAFRVDESGEYILGSSNGVSVGEGHEYDFVAAPRLPIPGAVLAYERPAGIVLRQ